MSWCKINFHMAGSMEEIDGKSYYINGFVEEGVMVDMNIMSWSFVKDFVKSHNISGALKDVWFKLPYESLDEKRHVVQGCGDNEMKLMFEMTTLCGELDVYIDHHISQPTPVKQRVDSWVYDESSDYMDEFREYESSDDDFVEVPVVDEVDVIEDEEVNWSADYLDSDDHIPLTPEGTDEEWDNFDKPKTKIPTTFPSNEFLYLGKPFNSGEEFKKALFDYVINKNFNVKLSRWDRTKLAAVCCNVGCPWRIYCSVEVSINKWMIKIYKDDHNHIAEKYANMLTMRQIANLYVEKIRADPSFKGKKIQDEIQRDHNLTVSLTKCFKARSLALKVVREDQEVQFRKLWDYELELQRSNPNTSTEIGTNAASGQQVFHRFYVCFDVLRESWTRHCRPVIGLDGCFLKWDFKGELLSAVGRDANDGIYPIAWAVVRIEDTDNWTWFVRKLRLDLVWAMGLVNAIEGQLPLAEHRMCTRYVFANWKKQFKDLELKLLFWKAAKSYLESEFRQYVRDIRMYNPLAYDGFMRAQPKKWCRAFFNPDTKCHDVNNNLSESFNGSIKEARSRPMIDMLEDIRRSTMRRIVRRASQSERCKTEFPPRIMKALEKSREKSRHCYIIRSGHGKYEVSEFGELVEVLIEWEGLSKHDATWEIGELFNAQFPTFKLEDKLRLQGGGVDKPFRAYVRRRSRKRGAKDQVEEHGGKRLERKLN
ncbi:PREDICTED: uncharacterized protein LOC104821184 [Tarenaya hassleriana]|uniref:uncharacterized protein LOC104821184 n=1 Tax=Tarenaya hassleriana TaxID=28532 RepID=UPI00053C231C|nr:PREDICTED: uncharacterized protein LOC104821184 [Tarenaya hassleriana]